MEIEIDGLLGTNLIAVFIHFRYREDLMPFRLRGNSNCIVTLPICVGRADHFTGRICHNDCRVWLTMSR